MRNSVFTLLISIIVLLTGCATCKMPVSYNNAISPISLGLLKAQTGEKRYEILQKTHQQANAKGVLVDYRGIGSIDITIPVGAKPIPLGAYNDFAGVALNVTNKAQNQYLFSWVNKAVSIDVTGRDIDRGAFSDYKQLNSGTVLLAIEDKNPWVENRKGYAYGHQRQDILLIKNGRAKNKPVMPYDNKQSSPVCKFYVVNHPSLTISNLTLNRAADCTAETFLCKIVGADNLCFNHIIINTPSSDLVNDMAFYILDCTNVQFKDVTINGTYSRKDHSGYGICMNNILNYCATRLKGSGNWGIFGNNNINKSTITNSEINRFDIHCYGRDVSFKDVKFTKLYNQFSSVFGSIVFNRCSFDDFVPVIYEPSYDVQNAHEVVFRNCTFYATPKRNFLVALNTISTERKSRPELYEKCWPKVSVENLKVIVPDEVLEMSLFYTTKLRAGNNSPDRVSDISINGMDFIYEESASPINMFLSNIEVQTYTPINLNIKRLNIIPKSVKIEAEDSAAEGGHLYIHIREDLSPNRFSIKRSRIINSTLSR